jgi:hypothetical protein
MEYTKHHKIADSIIAARHRADWDAAMAVCKAVRKATEEDEAISGEEDDDLDAAAQRVDDCARRILAQPVNGRADIKLLAEICCWAHSGYPDSLRRPDTDQFLTDTCNEALAALLRAIRDMPDRG